LLEIQPFLRKNDIIPKNYYLSFILEYEHYSDNENYKEIIENYNFKYIYFDSTHVTIHNIKFVNFKYNFDNGLKGKTYQKIDKINRFIFIKDFDFEKYNNKYFGPIYYTYNEMAFSDFIDELFEDKREKDENFQIIDLKKLLS